MQLIFKSVSLIKLTLLFYSLFSTLRLLTELTWLNRVLILVVVVSVWIQLPARRWVLRLSPMSGHAWARTTPSGSTPQSLLTTLDTPTSHSFKLLLSKAGLLSCQMPSIPETWVEKRKGGWNRVTHNRKTPPPLLFPYQSFESPQVLHLSHDCCCTLNRTFHWFWFITKDSYTLHVLLRQAFVERKFILQILYFYHYIYSSHSIILFMMHFEYSCCTFGFQPFLPAGLV